MNQAQYSKVEQIIALNKAYRVEHHEKPWGVLVDVKGTRRPSGRWATESIFWLNEKGDICFEKDWKVIA